MSILKIDGERFIEQIKNDDLNYEHFAKLTTDVTREELLYSFTGALAMVCVQKENLLEQLAMQHFVEKITLGASLIARRLMAKRKGEEDPLANEVVLQ